MIHTWMPHLIYLLVLSQHLVIFNQDVNSILQLTSLWWCMLVVKLNSIKLLKCHTYCICCFHVFVSGSPTAKQSSTAHGARSPAPKVHTSSFLSSGVKVRLTLSVNGFIKCNSHLIAVWGLAALVQPCVGLVQYNLPTGKCALPPFCSLLDLLPCIKVVSISLLLL